MRNFLLALIFLVSLPIIASAQYSFGASVDINDDCCISIKAGNKSNPNDTSWEVVVDGTTTYNVNSPATTGLSIKHCLGGNGTHVIQFFVNGQLYWTKTVTITECAPCEVCNISDMLLWPHIMDTCANTVSLAVTFPNINGVQGPSPLCTNASYTWSYGDGNTNTTTDPYSFDTHTYNSPGTYEVCVTYSTINPDGDTCTVTKCDSIVVAGCVACEVCNISDMLLWPHVIDTCANTVSLAVTFPNINGVQGPSPLCTNASYTWSYGDGHTNTTTDPYSFDTHTYNSPGTYEVCVTYSTINPNGDTCRVTKCDSLVVSGCDACEVCNVSDMLLWPNIIDTCANTVSLAVTFPNINGVQGPSPLCTNASYTWSYGDGNTNTTTDPYSFDTHTYNSSGTYQVCVTYSTINPDGDTCTITKCDSIVVSGCDGDECCGFEMKDPSYQIAPPPFSPCLVRLSAPGTSFITGCGITVSWDINGDGISDGTGNTLITTFNGPGPHYVCVTMSSTTTPQCTPITKCMVVYLPNCTGVTSGGNGQIRNLKNNTITNEEWETAIEKAATESVLELFPNPATNELNIKLPNDATSTIESIQVINVNGQVVKTEHAISTNLLSIDISTLPSGVYMVRTMNKDGMTQTTKQFVKNK
jgi:PKD repeat protein